MESKLEPNCNGRGRLKADPGLNDEGPCFSHDSHATVFPSLRIQGDSPARMQRMFGHTRLNAKDEFPCTRLDGGTEHTVM